MLPRPLVAVLRTAAITGEGPDRRRRPRLAPLPPPAAAAAPHRASAAAARAAALPAAHPALRRARALRLVVRCAAVAVRALHGAAPQTPARVPWLGRAALRVARTRRSRRRTRTRPTRSRRWSTA